MTLPTFADVEDAAARLRGVAHRTPTLASRTVNSRTGATVFFKCENFQRGGAFKFRGAYNALVRLSEDERRRGVVTFSSGNHAQAIALAGRVLDIPRVIVMPSDAPSVKRAATARTAKQSEGGSRPNAASRSSRRTTTRTSSPGRVPRHTNSWTTSARSISSSCPAVVADCSRVPLWPPERSRPTVS
jgi:threonine dehydratase